MRIEAAAPEAKLQTLRETERALAKLDRTLRRESKALLAEVRRILAELSGDVANAWRILSAKETRKALEDCAKELDSLERKRALSLLGDALILVGLGLRKKSAPLRRLLSQTGAGGSPAGGSVADVLAAAAVSGVRMTRMEAALLRVDAACAGVFPKVRTASETLFRSVTRSAYYRELHALERAAGMFPFPLLTRGGVTQIVDETWWGKLWTDRLWGHVRDFDARMKNVVREGVRGGFSLEDMEAQIAKLSNQTAYNVRRLVRTESARCAEHATLAAYRERGVERYQYLATLDMRTSDVCRDLDGQAFAVEAAQTGLNYPPMHPNCRSTTVAVVDGLDTSRDERYARDPVNGKGTTVPADWDYKTWYKERVENRPQAVATKNMARNRSADAKQYARYVAALGKKNMPSSLDAFLRMKYTDTERYGLVRLDYRRRQALLEHPERALPNAKAATAADAKFTKYLFNPENADGWAKGVAFTSRLGYDINNWQEFRNEVLNSAKGSPSVVGSTNAYGTRYTQFVVLYGKKGAPMNVKIGWKADKAKTWMTTIMPKEV